MNKVAAAALFLAALLFRPPIAAGHCDAVDGPVASAAIKALETKNAYLVLPYVPAEAEPEIIAAFRQALVVRGKGAEAKALADRYFMETAVRLHRLGEGAPYTGLKAAGTDFGPAIPAAEKALETEALTPLLRFLVEELQGEIIEQFEYVLSMKETTKEPRTRAEVQPARERVSAELDFIGHVEAIYRAIEGGGHAEYE